jgi:hypothetical protein
VSQASVRYGRQPQPRVDHKRFRNDPLTYVLMLVGGIGSLATIVYLAWPSLDDRLIVIGSVVTVGMVAAAFDAPIRRKTLLLLASTGEGIGQVALGAVLAFPLAVGSPSDGLPDVFRPEPSPSPTRKIVEAHVDVARGTIGAFEGTLAAAPPCRAGRTIVVWATDRAGRTVRFSGTTESDGSWIALRRPSSFRAVGVLATWDVAVHPDMRMEGGREVMCRAHRIGRRIRDRAPGGAMPDKDPDQTVTGTVPSASPPPIATPTPLAPTPTPPSSPACRPPAAWNEMAQRCL